MFIKLLFLEYDMENEEIEMLIAKIENDLKVELPPRPQPQHIHENFDYHIIDKHAKQDSNKSCD